MTDRQTDEQMHRWMDGGVNNIPIIFKKKMEDKKGYQPLDLFRHKLYLEPLLLRT